MVVDHAHAAVDAQIAEAQDVGTAQVEQQQHFSRPGADTVDRAERRDCFFVAHVRNGFDVEGARIHFHCEIFDVPGFLERYAA